MVVTQVEFIDMLLNLVFLKTLAKTMLLRTLIIFLAQVFNNVKTALAHHLLQVNLETVFLLLNSKLGKPAIMDQYLELIK